LNVREYNRAAWNQLVEQGDRWTQPVSPQVIADARRDVWSVLLTEQKPVPREWFPKLRGAHVLCLASGGGQQAPIFAAAGAIVTALDNSPRQLERDIFVAEREGLEISPIEGDMRDLSAFSDESFDLVFHPVSNLFVPEVRPVWREAFRVLKRGGVLLAGIVNPVLYAFSYDALDGNAPLVVKNVLPYSDAADLPTPELDKLKAEGLPLEHSHTLTDQLGGQLDAGFHITALYEDYHAGVTLSQYMPTYIATRAVKE
jgi:SAM-dependent methyltransferase